MIEARQELQRTGSRRRFKAMLGEGDFLSLKWQLNLVEIC